ncbi:response regulator [uncultured Mucilaginibacter sp.]|uniref:response regulator n=1 Tax=uncultured Mucilaginibacter sp. TaxID=797541 RepID=UPI0025E40A21|nr:response regulator [uncultured Mucilaginibacter sp.]
MLVLERFRVITADWGLAAVLLVRGQLPDLIICDTQMPGMNGYEVLSSLRENLFICHIPFFSTANSENREAQKAKSLGIQNYLVKPFDGFELMNCVEKCLLESNRRGLF